MSEQDVIQLTETEEDELTLPISSLHDIASRVKLIGRLETRKAQLKELKRQEVEYYESLIAREEQRIAEVKSYIRGYMQTQGVSNLPTFAGTVKLVEKVDRGWPDDGALLAWAKQNFPQAVVVETTESVDKKKLLELATMSNTSIPGYTETPRKDVTITGLKKGSALNGISSATSDQAG